jgi:hypothetical protein
MMSRAEFRIVVGAAVLAGFVGGMAAGKLGGADPAIAQQRQKAVNSEEFLLVDKFGRTRAGLGLGADGAVALILLDKDGTRTLTLSPDEKQAVQLKGKDGKVLWAAP